MQKEATLKFRGDKFNWPMTAFMIFFHAGAVLALFNFTWPALGLAIFLWWLAGSLGIGMGYHRLLTHRGFRTPKWLERLLVLFGVLALEGGPIPWVATHRVHHTATERDGDPHSPRHGFWWAHMGWLLRGQSPYLEVKAEAAHVKDLTNDKFYRLLTDWHFLPQIVLAGILYAFGGWSFVLWGIFVRVVFSWHATWFVNSAAHVSGTRRFETRDDSRNNWWVALVSHGEGWHNNHHAHPSAARHGLAWYEVDVNWYGIWTLKKLGLAKNIRLADWPKKTAAVDEAKSIKAVVKKGLGDGHGTVPRA